MGSVAHFIIPFYMFFGTLSNIFMYEKTDNSALNVAYTNQSGLSTLILQEPSVFDAIGFIIQFAVDTVILFLRMAILQVQFVDNGLSNLLINFMFFAPLSFSILYEGVNLIRGRSS